MLSCTNAENVSTTRLQAASLELGRVTLTINGISAGLKAINGGSIDFIVPANAGIGVKPVVINKPEECFNNQSSI